MGDTGHAEQLSDALMCLPPGAEAHPHHPPGVDALHTAHGFESTIEGAEGLLHTVRGVHAGAQGSPAQFLLGMLGIPLGGVSMGIGIDEMSKGEYSQGALDILSGGLGMVSGVASIAAGAGAGGALAAAAAPLAIAAGLAGLGAYGNEDAQKAGAYGKDEHGENATFLGSIGKMAGDGYGMGMDAGHDLLGDNIAGDLVGGLFGGVAGGFGAIGKGILNSGDAVAYGGKKLGTQALHAAESGFAEIGGPQMLGTGFPTLFR